VIIFSSAFDPPRRPFRIVLTAVAFLVGIAVQGALAIVATVLVTVGFGGVLVGFPAAVGLAILAVAALFQPARRRIQQGVDRRFNRRKYTTAQTIEAFSARLRDEVDLDTPSAEVLAVVDQTMQPTTATLWLRPTGQGSRRTAR
jgi:hypothetical protein